MEVNTLVIRATGLNRGVHKNLIGVITNKFSTPSDNSVTYSTRQRNRFSTTSNLIDLKSI